MVLLLVGVVSPSLVVLLVVDLKRNNSSIKKGITVFKIFMWGGISSDILSEI